MKTSLRGIPVNKQKDLEYLVRLVLKKIPQTEMIILYGSYATGNFVTFDRRVDFGICTTYLSDYDILVVTSGIKDQEVGHKLDNITFTYSNESDKQTPVQFINLDINKLNKNLTEGRYFYCQIKQTGIMLYNSGKYKLARRRPLRYNQILEQAKEYYGLRFQSAFEFYMTAKFSYENGFYNKAAFLLHQASENLFHTMHLVFTLDNNKQHNLEKLLKSVRKYSYEFERILSRDTQEDIRLFNLLKDAYVSARYDPQFVVTKEDAEALTAKVERLMELVKRLSEERIGEYEKEAYN